MIVPCVLYFLVRLFRYCFLCAKIIVKDFKMLNVWSTLVKWLPSSPMVLRVPGYNPTNSISFIWEPLSEKNGQF